MLHGRDYDENGYLFMVTRGGTVKRTEKSAFRNIRTVGLRVLTLEEGGRAHGRLGDRRTG